ncbi:MAG: nitroreductase family protein, partial [Desulfobacteraceae bacterium]
EIPQEHMDQILESIRWSPSWANTQCWEVVLVKDPAVKEKLQETLPRTNPASKGITQAPVVLALCGKLKSSGYYKGEVTTKLGDWFMFDLGIATQSLCLTAHSLGLGTVIVGLFDHNRVKEILGLGENFEVVVLIPIGYPAKDAPAPKRREISEFTHYDKF